MTTLWDSATNSCRSCGAVNDTPCSDDCPGSSNYQSPEDRIAELETQMADVLARLGAVEGMVVP
jgi:hypothetical protein